MREAAGERLFHSLRIEELEVLLDAGACALDGTGRLLEVGPRAAALLRAAPETLRGRPFEALVTSADAPAVRALVERGTGDAHVRSAGGAAVALRAARAGDARVIVRVSAQDTQVVTASVDLDTWRHTLEELRESEARLSTVFQSLPFDCWVMDATGRYRMQNEASRANWGEQIGRRPEETGVPPGVLAQWQARNRRAMAGEVVRQRVSYERGGETRYYEAIVAPVRNGDQVCGILGMNVDITDNIRLTMRLSEAEKMEAIGRLAGGIAHDFNNILTAIIGACQVAERRAGDAPVRSELKVITHGATRAAALTRQLLAYARRELVEPRVLAPAEVLQQVEQLLRGIIGEHIAIEVSPGPRRWTVRADPVGLERSLVNLALNARDAMPAGGRLALRIDEEEVGEAMVAAGSTIAPGPYVVLTVSDTGRGMDAATVAHIFEPFFTAGKEGGTGLGLASCYGFVRQSDGHVRVETSPGNGATFRIYLPRAGSTSPVPRAPVERPAAGRGEHILLVEDEDAVRETLAASLRDLGYEVLEAAGVAAGLALARAADPPLALVVSDVVMADGNGLDFVDQLHAEGLAERVLFISGYAEGPALARRLARPGVAFLAKPFGPEALARCVRALLD